jgi:hypothetical protein
MTAAEKERFINVIIMLIQDGSYGELVSHHANMMHNMHSAMGFVGRQRFLRWHRVTISTAFGRNGNRRSMKSNE